MNIPFNTWAPDNQHFLIREQTACDAGTLVFRAGGEPFADGNAFLDVTPLFDLKKSGYNVREVTGWAAPTLLIVNTKPTNQSPVGPSFWFDISRKSVIRLST